MSVPTTPTRFSLFKRNNGFWYVLYEKDARKHWKSTGTRSKQEALRALAGLADLIGPKPAVVLLSRFVEDLLSYAEAVYSGKTRLMYRATLGAFLRLTGDVPLRSLTPKHLDLFKAARLKVISPVSVNIELRTLKAALGMACRWRLIEANPFKESPLVPVPDQSPVFFTREDFQKLMSLIREAWLRELIAFAVLTGMRRGEILNLKWDDVDLPRRLIRVESGPTFRTKQGRKRVVPMSDVVHAMLSAKAARQVTKHVFTLNGRKIKEDWPTQKLKQYVYRSNLEEKRLHFHSLRHTFASWLVQDGTSLYEVQRLLGHSSSRMTEVYSHLQPEALHRTVNRLNMVLN